MIWKRADVVIVGGGVIGAATAYYAAKQGASVILVEKGEIASGASYGNAGLVVPSHCEPLCTPGIVAEGLRELFNPEGAFYVPPKPDLDRMRWLWSFRMHCNETHYKRALEIYATLSHDSMQCHRQLAAIGGKEYHFQQKGILSPCTSPKTFTALCRFAERIQRYGFAPKVLSAEEVLKLEPSLRISVIGGILYSADGCLKPDSFVRWLARRAQNHGAEILLNTEVFGFDHSKKRVHQLYTTRGTIAADQVVLAAGAWTPVVARHLGARLPIHGAKGYSITYTTPQDVPQYPMLFEEARIAFTLFRGSVRFAGTLELSGLNLDINRRRVFAVHKQGIKVLPQAARWNLEEIWRGLRPCTPDGLPILGRLKKLSNVIVVSGHATKGMSMGPGTGRLTAGLLAGGLPKIFRNSLSPDRFGH